MLLAFLVAAPISHAAPDDKILAAIDGVLARTPTGHRDVDATAPCRAYAGIPSEAFWCDDRTKLVGRWRLAGLTVDNPALSDVTVEIRAFSSGDAAMTVKDIALERLGGGPIGPQEGCFTMCYEDVIWTDTLLVTMSYGCSASLSALTDLRRAVFALGVPHRGVAIGMRGFHSGTCRLLSPALDDAELWVVPDNRAKPLPDRTRFHHFARVTGTDVTGVGSAHDLSPPVKLDQLERIVGCVPLVVWAPGRTSWVIRVDGTDLKVPAEDLTLVNASKCNDHADAPRPHDG